MAKKRKLGKIKAALSCDAVRHFLIDGHDMHNGGTVKCKTCFDGKNYFEDEVIAQYNIHLGAYFLSTEKFQAWLHPSYIETNRYEYKWDAENGVLSVSTTRGDIFFTRR